MKEYIKTLLRENLLDEEVISGRYYHGSVYPKITWGEAPEAYDRSLHGYGIYVTTSKEEAMMYAASEYHNTEGYLFSMNLSNLNVVDFKNEKVSSDVETKLKSDPNFYSEFYVKFDENEFNVKQLIYNLGDNITYDWDYISEEVADGVRPGYNFIKYLDGKNVDEVYGLSEDDILPKIKSYNDVGELEKVVVGELGSGFDWELDKVSIFKNYYNLYFYIEKKLKSLKSASKFFVGLGIDGFKAEGYGVDGIYLDSSDYIVCILNPSKLKDVKGKKVTPNDIKKIKDYYK